MDPNPLVPTGFDVAASLIVVIVIAATIVALVSIVRAGRGIRPAAALVWALIVLFVPMLGAVAWFVAGKPARARSDAGDPA
ncbi:PLD nuclease N-terminal domain-containing protein [Microbacterium sp. KR10-403]|uniref:PLD nuclease N-terminal domain-containing protein n=1 Tax=Microbacterium sp. KR10-403 TaxID=3158581 RepID=UPI0032E3F515